MKIKKPVVFLIIATGVILLIAMWFIINIVSISNHTILKMPLGRQQGDLSGIYELRSIIPANQVILKSPFSNKVVEITQIKITASDDSSDVLYKSAVGKWKRIESFRLNKTIFWLDEFSAEFRHLELDPGPSIFPGFARIAVEGWIRKKGDIVEVEKVSWQKGLVFSSYHFMIKIESFILSGRSRISIRGHEFAFLC